MAAASAGGDTFPAGPNSFLHVKNAGGSPVTVTVTPPPGSGPLGTTISALALAPAVAATTGENIFGPFPVNPFGDANGNVNVTYSATASVTVKALTMAAS
jgi:uncharacterized protein (UPF0371 family)